MKIAERYLRQLDVYQDKVLKAIKEWREDDPTTCRLNTGDYHILLERKQGNSKVTITYKGNAADAPKRIVEGVSLNPYISIKDYLKSDKMEDGNCKVSVGVRDNNGVYENAYYALEFGKDATFNDIVSQTVKYYGVMRERIGG